MVKDYLPLQQGLRHVGFWRVKKATFSQRLSSITTRIKTHLQGCHAQALLSQRLSSITTRIKTQTRSPTSPAGWMVKDYLPLQQGLRPLMRVLALNRTSCQRLSSITTRIKTSYSYLSIQEPSCQRLSSITTRIKTPSSAREDRYPRCQRLSSITTRIKTGINDTFPGFEGVKDYLPLQQGLRQPDIAVPFFDKKCQRLSSITTRIKTHWRVVGTAADLLVKDYLPLQQGLRQ